MVLPGKANPRKAPPEEVAQATLEVLRRTVPAAVPTINFLSGGQSATDATANLDAMNRMAPHAPWVLSFSYARALQDDAMRTWAGRPGQVAAAQRAFHHRARMNSLARHARWTPAAESAA
jgi:fructose-bisphosphate aldolase class I